jgi:hypothetical protein
MLSKITSARAEADETRLTTPTSTTPRERIRIERERVARRIGDPFMVLVSRIALPRSCWFDESPEMQLACQSHFPSLICLEVVFLQGLASLCRKLKAPGWVE